MINKQFSRKELHTVSLFIASKEGFPEIDLFCEICSAKSQVISYSPIRSLLILYLKAKHGRFIWLPIFFVDLFKKTKSS